MNVPFLRPRDGRAPAWQSALSLLLAVGLFAGFFAWSLDRLGLHLDFAFLWKYRVRLLYGFEATVAISAASLVLSLAIGFASALAERSRFLPLSMLSKVYVQFIRGTPMIMQIYLFFYIIGTAWGIENRYLAGVLILSIFEGAYIAEIIRGGMSSIESTQLEAAKAVGLDAHQTMGLVILPQLGTRILPALAGQFASIIKDSSLLSIIAVIELAQATREISAATFAIFESYIFLGLLYLSLTLPLSLITRALERRFRYEA
jgi:polar amino acid transport system permease protein